MPPIADPGVAVLAAAEDRMSGAFKPRVIRKTGLAVPAAVRLTMADSVPPAVRAKVEETARDIASGKLVVSTEWSGPEFASPPAP